MNESVLAARGTNVVCYDVETRRRPGCQVCKAEPRVPCEHGRENRIFWNDVHKMGVAVLGVYDFSDDRMRFYADTEDEKGHITWSNLREGAERIARAGLRFSFCGRRFDDKVIRAASGVSLPEDGHYDLFWEAQRACNLDPNNPKFGSVGNLGDIAMATLGRGKVEDGADVAEMCRRGEWARIYTYCADDVFLVRDLALHVREHKFLVSPKPKYGRIAMPAPQIIELDASDQAPSDEVAVSP